MPSIQQGDDLPSVQHCFYLSQSQWATGLPATWQWETQFTAANGLFSINNVSNLLWFCSCLIHIYRFGGLIPPVFLPLFTWLQLPLLICDELHENKERVNEKDMKTTTEQGPHYRCLFPIPDYQTQTAFVSHTQLTWHNPKLMLGNRNPSIGFNTFQSRGKEGKVVTVTKQHFYYSTRNHSKTSFSQLLAELLRRNKLCCTALASWGQFFIF